MSERNPNRDSVSIQYDRIYEENVEVIPPVTSLSKDSESSHHRSIRSPEPSIHSEFMSGSLDANDHAPQKNVSPLPIPPPDLNERPSHSSPSNSRRSEEGRPRTAHRTFSFLPTFSFSLSRSHDPHDRSPARSQRNSRNPHAVSTSRSGSNDVGDEERPRTMKRTPSATLGKAKSFTRKMTAAYLGTLKETARSRFHDWSREELIELLVGPPFHYEIRNELHIAITALRDVADSLWQNSPLPPRPDLPTEYEITLFNVMARRIQDAWVNYVIYQREEAQLHREMNERKHITRLRSSIEFDEEVVGKGDLIRGGEDDLPMYLLRQRSQEEIIADEDIEIGKVLSNEEIMEIETYFQQQEDEQTIEQRQLKDGVAPGEPASLQQIITHQPSYDASSLHRKPKAAGESKTDGLTPDVVQARGKVLAVTPSFRRVPSNDGKGFRINVFDIPWSPPEVTLAKNYSNYVQPRKHRRKGLMYDFHKTTTGRYCCLDGLGEQFDLWEEGQVSEFAQYGSGVTNYFKFMKWTGWLFLLLSVIALPMMVLNYNASSVNNRNSGLRALAKTTLGNLALTSVNETFSITIPGCSRSVLVDSNCELNGSDLALLYAILDIVISIVVMVAFLWLNYFQQHEEQELSQTLVKPSMYSVAVTHLPKDTTDEELTGHFMKLLDTRDPTSIANISIAYNNSLEIDLCFQRGELMKQKVLLVHQYRHHCTTVRSSKDYNDKMEEGLQKEKDKMLKKMKDINNELSLKEKALEVIATKDSKDNNNNEVITAFITFDKAKDRDYILSLYENLTFWHYCCYSNILKLRDKWISVHEAPDPSVIIWENLMFQRRDRVKRRLITTFFTLLLIVLSLIMIFASKYLEEKASNNGYNQTVYCPDNFQSWTTADQKQYVEDNPDALYCYCEQKDTLAQAKDSTCRHYLRENAQAQVLIYFASFIILLINNNNVILRSLFGIEVTAAPEFTASWYNSVGVTIILVQLGSIINCHADSIYRYYFYNKTKDDALLHPEKSLTQDELNKKFIGPKFDLAYNYAELLTTIFVSLTFATGIPLLYPIAAVNFFIYYFTEKFFFINMYKIPPHFNTTVGKRVTMFVPIALGIHLGMSIWMLSNHKLFSDAPTAFDDDHLTGNTSLETYYYSANNLASHRDFTGYTRRRVIQRATLPLLICFAAVLFIWVSLIGFRYFRVAAERFFAFWCTCFHPRHLPSPHDSKTRPNNQSNQKSAGRSGKNGGGDIEQGIFWSSTTKKNAEPTRYLVTYSRAIQRNLIKGLATYNVLQNPKYKEAFGITWKFAVDHSRVRSVRELKLKALNPAEEDRIENMEIHNRGRRDSGSSAGGRSHKTAATSPRTGEGKTSEEKEAGSPRKKSPRRANKPPLPKEQSIAKNKSFYEALHAPITTTPTAVTSQKAGSSKKSTTSERTPPPSNHTSAKSAKKQERSRPSTPTDGIELLTPPKLGGDSRPPSTANSLKSSLKTDQTKKTKENVVVFASNDDVDEDEVSALTQFVIDDATLGSAYRQYPEDDDITAYSYDGVAPRPSEKTPRHSGRKEKASGKSPHNQATTTTSTLPRLHHSKDLELGSTSKD